MAGLGGGVAGGVRVEASTVTRGGRAVEGIAPAGSAERHAEEIQPSPSLPRTVLQQRQNVVGHRRVEILQKLDAVVHRAHGTHQIVAQSRADEFEDPHVDVAGQGWCLLQPVASGNARA